MNLIRPQLTSYRKRRRTNIMIILVSVTFFLSWLPLNVLNAVMEIEPELVETHLGNAMLYFCFIINQWQSLVTCRVHSYYTYPQVW